MKIENNMKKSVKEITMDNVNGFKIVKDQEYGYRHIYPIPSEEELDRIYKEEYYSLEKPDYTKRMSEDVEWWNSTYSDRYDTFEELLPKSKRKILDVGSGPGFFLKHGKDRGWETKGIEPSRQAAKHSRDYLGLDIKEEFLSNDNKLSFGKHDLINMSLVLEHIPNPKQMLRIAYDLLDENGLVCIVVPNDFNPFQQALVKACDFKPWWLSPPHHINYFDFESLSKLLVGSGFEVVFKEATFPIDLFLLMGDNYVGNDTVGHECHKRRMSFENNMNKAGLNKIKRELYVKFAELGLGRETVIIGRKI